MHVAEAWLIEKEGIQIILGKKLTPLMPAIISWLPSGEGLTFHFTVKIGEEKHGFTWELSL